MTQPNRWAGLALAITLLTGCAGAAPQTAENTTTSEAGTEPGAVTEATTDTVTGPTTTDMVTNTTPALEAPKLSDKAVTTDSGLQYEDTLLGEGDEAQSGDLVTVHYTGYLEDGTVFDTSVPTDNPIKFSLGAGRVIVGWDEGVTGMKVGGKRLLVIPPDLGYGEEENGPIPANSTLVFEVELMEVVAQATPATVDEGDYITTDTGLQYAILVEGEGDEAKPEDVVEFNFRAWREDGVMFDSSEQAGRTAQFPLGQSGLPGLDQGIEGMKAGETRQIRIPPDLAYGAEGAGDVIPPDETIIFEIELVKIVPPPEQAEVDEGDYTTTESGLQYFVLAEGEGEATAATGDTVAMHYSGWLEDGTLFDSSLQRGEPFTFTIGQGSVIAGWDEGIVGMKVGEKRQFRIPGELAYGEAGRGAIPPNATLIFDVELVEILE